MKISASPLLVLCALGVAAGFRVASVRRSGEDKTITKIVKLLQGMLDKSEAEGKSEKELYDKFKCYCDDNTEEKETAVADLTKEIGILENRIAELQGSNGKLSVDVAELQRLMDENEAAQNKSQKIRDEQKQAFESMKGNLTIAIGQLDDAITTLGEVGADQTAGSSEAHTKFMAGYGKDEASASMLKLRSTLKEALVAASSFVNPGVQQRKINAFLQAPFSETYTAQSGEIVGILKNMKTTFEDNIAAGQTAEDQAVKAFNKFMKTKGEEFDTMQSSLDTKSGKLGSNDGDLSTKKDQLVQSKTSKDDAEKFLENLAPLCKEKKEDFERRNLFRANEQAAISQAISLLSSDHATDKFGKVDASSTGATGLFVQIAARRSPSRTAVRRDALRLLQGAKGTRGSKKVSKVIALLREGNAFTTVLEQITKMKELIVKEGEVDQAQLSWCNSERTEKQSDIDAKDGQMTSLDTEIGDLDADINDPAEGLKKAISDDEEALEENSKSQADETKMRRTENLDYQTTIKNCVDGEDLLDRAINVLKKYYADLEKSQETDFVQEDPAPPDTWEGKFEGQKEEGNKVIGMLEFVLKETQKEEAAAHKSEQEAQHAYEDSMKSLVESEKTLQEGLVDAKATLAEKEKELEEKRAQHSETEVEKRAIERYMKEIKSGCDFVTDNFDARETARGDETAALEKVETKLKGTPAYEAAVLKETHAAWGECKEACVVDETHVDCKACLAGVSKPGYCAGHADTPGCS